MLFSERAFFRFSTGTKKLRGRNPVSARDSHRATTILVGPEKGYDEPVLVTKYLQSVPLGISDESVITKTEH